MKFDIAGVRFDKTQRYLQQGEQKRQLEPKVFALLTCLIEANGQLVSREQLLQQVWNGRVVGEGAINRTISLLRAHFSVFTLETVIETVPTQGYRLRVDVNLIVEDSAVEAQTEAVTTTDTNDVPWLQNSAETTSKATLTAPSRMRSTPRLFMVFAALISFIALTVLTVNTDSSSDIHELKLTKSPLISLKGWEYQVSASDDGKTLLFHHLTQDQRQEVVLYRPEQHQQSVILQDALATISPDGKKVFFAKRLKPVNPLTNKQVEIEQCQTGIYDIASATELDIKKCEHLPTELKWASDNYIYFNQRHSKSHPYQVFRRHLTTGQLQQVSNPKSNNNTRGDFKFSIQPNTQQLALLRYVDENTTDVLFYNDLTLQHQVTVNQGLKHLAWHPNHRDLVVTNGNVVYHLTKTSGRLTKLTQLNNHINSIALFKQGNQSHLLLSDAVLQSEIVQFDLQSQRNTVWQSSGRVELLPRIQADRAVFMSTRYQGHHWWQIKADNGTEQATTKAELIDVSLPFPLGFTRYQLSPHGDHMLFTKSGAVFELDLEHRTLHQLFDDTAQAYVANYQAGPERDILYSSNRSGQWQLWRYNRQHKRHTQLTTSGGYNGVFWQDNLLYSKFASDGLWLKSSDKDIQLIADFDRINWLNWHIRGDNLYFYRANSGIWRFNLLDNTESLIMPVPSQFVHQYTVSPDQQYVYWVRRLPMSGDIYQYSFTEQ